MEDAGQALGSRRSGQGEIRFATDKTVGVVEKPELVSETNPAVDLAKTISHGEPPSNKQVSNQ